MVNNLLLSIILAFLVGLVASECPPESDWLHHQRCNRRPQDYPVRETTDGPVGGECSSSLGREICSFKGIPFAAPPVNELRFMPPTPPKPWTKTQWAFNFGHTCMGVLTTGASEDCLYINVYVPQGKCSASTPCSVMVWFYGGGFVAGSGNSDLYGPEFFMDEEVIMVTFNYRLGAYGFTSTEDHNIPGNAGLLDQQAALKWVQANIAAFGGNRDSVTIFGQSAGGASVTYHCLSDGSAGLFHKAIMQSGSALSEWASERHPLEVAKALASELGIRYTDTADLATKLKEVSAWRLNSAARSVLLDNFNIQVVTRFAPHVDYNDPPFLPDTPQNLLKHFVATNKSICHGAQLMSGMTITEGGFARVALLLDPLYLTRLPFNKESLTPQYCNLQKGSSASVAVGNKIYRRYFGLIPTNFDFYRYVTGALYVAGESEFYKAYIRSGKPAHIYNFQYCGPANYLRVVLFGILSPCRLMGPVHADDLFLMWTQTGIELPGILSIIGDAIKLASQSTRTPAEVRLRRQIVGSFANFAKTGEPTPTEAVDSLFGVRWEPSTDASNIRVYNFDSRLSMSRTPHASDADFWANVCSPN